MLYIRTHFAGPHAATLNETLTAPWVQKTTQSQLNVKPTYKSAHAESMYHHFEAIHNSAIVARQENLKALKWLDKLQRDAFFAGYWNWRSDSERAN